MDKRFIYLFYSLLLILSAYSCNNSGSSDSGDVDIPDSIFEKKPLLVSNEQMENIIQNISSPVEMAALLKNTGVPFQRKILASTNRIDKLNTNFKRALNLGIMGADLGYLNMYEKTGSVMENLSSIKSLSEELKIGQFFDFSTIKRLAMNSENLDSLMYISVASFNNMDEYLRKVNRTNISSLIVTGIWIEGMYLSTQVAKEAPKKEIVERIGEQKIILNDLLIILKNYSSDRNFYELVQDIEKIKKEYQDVKITYEVGEPESKEVDGMLIIVQNEKSIVTMSDEQLVNITRVVEEVRNKLINM